MTVKLNIYTTRKFVLTMERELSVFYSVGSYPYVVRVKWGIVHGCEEEKKSNGSSVIFAENIGGGSSGHPAPKHTAPSHHAAA
jgi:hypothetical protein